MAASGAAPEGRAGDALVAPLREYLDGALVGAGQRCFEAGLNPVVPVQAPVGTLILQQVRLAMRERFPDLPEDVAAFAAATLPTQVLA